MGIALLTLSTLFQQRSARSDRSPSLRTGWALAGTVASLTTAASHLGKACKADQASRTEGIHAWAGLTDRKPLRVVQITDVHARPGAVGRLLMSGRMADVCAELDRLAALEDQHRLH